MNKRRKKKNRVLVPILSRMCLRLSLFNWDRKKIGQEEALTNNNVCIVKILTGKKQNKLAALLSSKENIL